MHYPQHLRDRAHDCSELARIAAREDVRTSLLELASSYRDWARDIEQGEQQQLETCTRH
jgi:hypothetical protein